MESVDIPLTVAQDSDSKMDLSSLNKVKVERVDVSPMKTETVIKKETYPTDSIQCFLCHITFCDSRRFERHMRSNHRAEYNQVLQKMNTVFTCYVCSRTFSSSVELTDHQVTHRTEEKPFHCKNCEKSFATFKELTEHYRSRCSKRKKIRSIHCRKCLRYFATKEDLQLHKGLFAGDVRCEDIAVRRKRGRPPKSSLTLAGKDNVSQSSPLESGNDCTDTPPIKRRGRPPKQKPQQHKDTLQAAPAKQELKIPCPVGRCKAVFNSVEMLRLHRKQVH